MRKFFDIVLIVQRKTCATLLLIMIVVTVIQIVARVILHLASVWTEELARVLMIWITFIGGTGMLIKGEHLAVDFLSSMYTPSMKKIARVFYGAIYVFFSCFMIFSGYRLVTNPIVMRSIMPAMRISRNFQYAIMPVSMIFMAMFSIYELVLSIKALFQKNEVREKNRDIAGGDKQ